MFEGDNKPYKLPACVCKSECAHYVHGCRNTLEGGGGSARLGKRNKQPMAQLVEVDIPGGPAVPQRAPVARDASVDPYIGRHIM